MNRVLLAGAAAAALLGATPAAFAQAAITCVNCDTLTQSLLAYARQLQELQQQIQTAENTLNFYVNAVTNTARLPSSVYRNLTGDVANIVSLMQAASMLQGIPKQLLTNLSSASGYPDSQLGSGSWEQLTWRENQAIAAAMQQAAAILNRMGQETAGDANTLSDLQHEAVSTEGRQATLQSLAGNIATVGQITQKQQATLAGALQAQNTYFTAQADRQSLMDGYAHVLYEGVRESNCASLAAAGGAAIPECAGVNTDTTIAATTSYVATVP